MLSEKEKEGINCILQKLSDSTLESLVFTTTKGLIKAESRKEAIKAIINYSESAYELLKRKKIKKEYLFNFLKENNVIISVTSEKWMVIKECLKFWNSDTTQVEEINDECMDVEQIPLDNDTTETTIISVTPYSNDGQTNFCISTKPNTSSSSLLPHQSNNLLPDADILDEMGRKFSEWFYNLINSIRETPNNFTPDHFWPDCTLKVQIDQVGAIINKQFSNSNDVAAYLYRLVTHEHMFFHPNHYYGTQCVTEVHGLVKIRVSGVLHQGDNCVGLFDQIFGLVRSAGDESNWKIKYSELLLKLKGTTLHICN
ncbi:uncharacterized protein C3orf38 homolog [Centruroides sculpturatus]|uniref:uncharacterized protein C3orf38 homolog n=1 Tax=Centruroides sculpturatus TaxID=218467 RepID=UPI000C6CD3D5|nr:uncharacterized protein C3orf38 homolog [Centruroides sculpturatus]XP_023241222.1 uncharacterized protein C3orf38 homolog [Centruroides sculpturatus]XP_023241223.1 uncharacterized protein C3orf38 homolog [Centruroides sculpturatus]